MDTRKIIFWFLVLVLLLPCPGQSQTWGNRLRENVRGIDVSINQGDIKWDKVRRDGYRFAFIKASAGDAKKPTIPEKIPNLNFTNNMKKARDAGILAGAYHFAYPVYRRKKFNKASEEADWFLKVAADYIQEGYLCFFP